jgi:hypothetical protein
VISLVMVLINFGNLFNHIVLVLSLKEEGRGGARQKFTLNTTATLPVQRKGQPSYLRLMVLCPQICLSTLLNIFFLNI